LKQKREENAVNVIQGAVKAKKARDTLKKKKEEPKSKSVQTEVEYMQRIGTGQGKKNAPTIVNSRQTTQGTQPPIYNDKGEMDGRSKKGGKVMTVSKKKK